MSIQQKINALTARINSLDATLDDSHNHEIELLITELDELKTLLAQKPVTTMNIQSEYGLLVPIALADIKVGETFYYQSSVGCFHETVCIKNDGYTIVTNRNTWLYRHDRLFKKVEATAQSVESNNSNVALPVKTKNSVVCTIATKLSKAGVKNPMKAAWNLYNAVLRMFQELHTGNTRLAVHIAKQIRQKIYRLDAHSIITDFFEYQTSEFIIVLAR